MINRLQVSRALIKAIAYAERGNPVQADAWARQLILALGREGILKTARQNIEEGRMIDVPH